MIQNTILLGTLAVAAYKDYKEQKVYVYGMILAGIVGILLHIFYQAPSLQDMLAGAAVGMTVLLIACVTRESIGLGDGIALSVSGIFLGFWQNLQLFLIALFLAGISALFLLIIKKKGRGYRIPFLPYMVLAYLILLL